MQPHHRERIHRVQRLLAVVKRFMTDLQSQGRSADEKSKTPPATPGGAATSASMSSLNAQHGEDEEHVELQKSGSAAPALWNEKASQLQSPQHALAQSDCVAFAASATQR